MNKKQLIYEIDCSITHYRELLKRTPCRELLKLPMLDTVAFRIESIIADLTIQKREAEKLDE